MILSYSISTGPNQPYIVKVGGRIIAIVPTYRATRAVVRKLGLA